ncbi:hypothetical protein Y032_0009g784 [Ancylostoma ceylanicum]|uniref:Galectin n=2 Tax=Ancylostoma ceylanicum TaxID=53326 RepID=A0A016VLD4_9BILA|nr:hypothetical protein Y032_0009g784 [Ancylostoma ceylanicum]
MSEYIARCGVNVNDYVSPWTVERSRRLLVETPRRTGKQRPTSVIKIGGVIGFASANNRYSNEQDVMPIESLLEKKYKQDATGIHDVVGREYTPTTPTRPHASIRDSPLLNSFLVTVESRETVNTATVCNRTPLLREHVYGSCLRDCDPNILIDMPDDNEASWSPPPPPAYSSAPPTLPIPQFAREVFNVSAPAELPMDGFNYGNRIRVVVQPLLTDEGGFAVNLKDEDDNILLHFNPRLTEEAVVFNTYDEDGWQYEERPTFPFPFQALRVYTIDFTSTGRNTVVIYLNGQFLHEFRERQLPFDDASSVEIKGDVRIHSIHMA